MLPSVSRSKAEEKAIISESYSAGGEELIVAGVVGVMAAIAVPNFLEAQGRATVSRVKTDQRSLAVALESYAIDHNHYPMWEMRTDFATQRPSFILPQPGTRPFTLTTPIAYITSIYPDPFSAGKKEWFSYYTSGRAWILISAGPDKDYDIVPQQDFQQPSGMKELLDVLVNKTYDPTNGSVSNGDIWRSNISH
jgi:type II secretory pathway pseudopilin PulG